VPCARLSRGRVLRPLIRALNSDDAVRTSASRSAYLWPGSTKFATLITRY
jgi:hypothetical protein